MDPVLLAIPIGVLIGLIVGAVGGGGGVLGLPALVYLLGEPVGPASTTSLIVVAVAASVGAGALAWRGHVCWRIALLFTPPAAAGSLLGTLANHTVSARTLILAFVPLTLAAAAATWRRAADTAGDEDEGCPGPRHARIAAGGLGVGVLTGFFGVGGGFMIVPVLTLWLGFGFRRAVATSLVILTLTGTAAVASHLAVGATVNAELTFAMAMATGVGALAGSILAQRVLQASLGRAFALLVAALGAFLLADVVLLGGPPGG